MNGIVGEASHPVSTEAKREVSKDKAPGRQGNITYIVETIIVGISRRGIISKKNRERSQAVGLE
jgi:hypothetical protein